MSGSGVPLPLSFIDKLYVSKVECPLHDNFDTPKIWFTPGESPVWDLSAGASKATPVAIYHGENSNTTFRVTLTTAALKPVEALTPPLSLVGKAGTWIVFSSQIKDATFDLAKDLVVNQPIVDGAAKPLPWALNSNITWTLSGRDPKQPTYTCDTDTEIYVFPPNLPNYVVRSGLPVRLLRLGTLWPAWMSSAAADWVAFVIDAIFEDPRLEYETWSGSSKYTSGIIGGLGSSFANDRGLEFWLDLWLTDMFGLNGVKTQLNCYDLACLVQVLVSLGTDAVASKVRAKYMSPYGYIQKTRLIGRIDSRPDNAENFCNNPFYGNNGYAKEMLVDDADSLRSAFGNHLFVTIDKAGHTYVLDACCGPQTGTVKLLEYPAKAIDTRSDNRGRPGTLFNIIDGIGVNHLVVSRALVRNNPPAPASGLLIDKVTQLDPKGTWEEPFFASPAQNYSISATWTFVPTTHPDETITINVFRYKDDDIPERVTIVQAAYTKRVATISDQWIAETANEGKSDGVTGSIRIFCNPYVGYLATVKASSLKTGDTSTLKDDFKKLLDASMVPKGTAWIKNVGTDKSLPIKVGQHFRITITPTAVAQQVWRGYTIKGPRGHALFLGAQQMPDNSVQFNFLARSSGFEMITLLMYDGNLDVEYRLINVWLED